MTDRCKNITLAKTSFRPVKIRSCSRFITGREGKLCFHRRVSFCPQSAIWKVGHLRHGRYASYWNAFSDNAIATATTLFCVNSLNDIHAAHHEIMLLSLSHPVCTPHRTFNGMATSVTVGRSTKLCMQNANVVEIKNISTLCLWVWIYPDESLSVNHKRSCRTMRMGLRVYSHLKTTRCLLHDCVISLCRHV